jgi:glycosyltransferase involved in cell wall biosynthesis
MDALSRLTTRERVELEERCSVLPMPPAPAPTVRSRTYAPPLRVLFAGRLDPSKGVDLLLQAVARTRFCRLTIAGSGPLAATLQPAVQRAGIEDRVDIVGLVPHNHLPELMSRHDVLVVPSLAPSPAHAALAEGTPAVLLEGMASGLVPVVSDVGGMAAWVRNGRNGLVFPQADVAALAAHLRFLSSNPRAAARLAAAALATAATCTHPRLVQTWAQHIPHLA